MQRNRWLLILGIGLPLVICLYLAGCGLAGFVFGRVMPTSAVTLEPPVSSEPTPVVPLVRRQPLSAEFETARAVTGSTVPQRDLLDLAHRLQGLPTTSDRPAPADPPAYELGDSLVFWVHDVETNSHYTSTAILRYETPHAYWWVEEGYDLPEERLKRSAHNFEDITYPTSRRLFGSEWNPGIDGDPHVYIYLGHVPGVGGYFAGPDEYPIEVRPKSNEHEMFYINLENAMPGSGYFDGILAHEFQHMIHWAQDRDESTWVNEGLAELSVQASGFDVGGSDLAFSMSPDTQLTTWSDLEDAGPHYGASYVFLAYFLEQYGEQAVRQLVSEQANGIAGFEALLATIDPDRSFQELFADWVVANYVDDADSDDGRYGYAALRIEEPALAALHDQYPVEEQATVHQYAADYILLQGEGDLTVEFTGSLLVPLVGNQVHSGDYQWWSNREDDGDATLTRAFDLTGLDSATLQAWLWYNLEEDYDYGYVQVSTDGGETWDILTNEHTTTTNPSGNSYGPALTGISGGGDEPAWRQQTFDLTPYAGQPVLIRFEVITDEALNYAGLCVDDISIPELAYTYDAESGDDDWQAEGWLRVTDHVPQQYLVQLISNHDARVEKMQLDEQMQGTITISGLGQEVDRAVLVVSALAPATTELASYEYRITRD